MAVIDADMLQNDEEQNLEINSYLKNMPSNKKWSFQCKFCDKQKQSPEVFCKKGVLANCAMFIGKLMSWSLFLIKFQAFRPATLLRRDSNTGVFLWILQNFYELLSYKTSANGRFWIKFSYQAMIWKGMSRKNTHFPRLRKLHLLVVLNQMKSLQQKWNF